MGDVLIGEITQHMLFTDNEIEPQKTKRYPDRFFKVCRGRSILFDKLGFDD